MNTKIMNQYMKASGKKEGSGNAPFLLYIMIVVNNDMVPLHNIQL